MEAGGFLGQENRRRDHFFRATWINLASAPAGPRIVRVRFISEPPFRGHTFPAATMCEAED
jgi:hypothetical protein